MHQLTRQGDLGVQEPRKTQEEKQEIFIGIQMIYHSLHLSCKSLVSHCSLWVILAHLLTRPLSLPDKCMCFFLVLF